MKYTGKVVGWGYYFPGIPYSNEDLAKYIDTSDEWITRRTGIKQRFFATPQDSLVDSCYKASLQAIQKAGWAFDSIDFVIVGTTTPDNAFPSTATKLQAKLGIAQAISFDVSAACAGFICALDVARMYITQNKVKRCLIIGADFMNRILDQQDRTTYVLFGDGVGAMCLETINNPKEGLIDTSLVSVNFGAEDLYVTPTYPNVIKMNGAQVYRQSILLMSESIKAMLEKHTLTLDEIEYVIPHQANKRIIQSIAKNLHISEEKMIITLDYHANVSAATIPVAFAIASEKGLIRSGKKYLFTALGGGYTYGSALVYM